MRLLDDIHAIAIALSGARDLLDRYLRHALVTQGTPPPVAAQIMGADDTPFAPPAYYDEDMNLRLNAATDRYLTDHGEWPSHEQVTAFVERNIDFSQELPR